ncbi:hypothetical protein LEMLEM_LOCUS12353 [Lemmus lemmus]
MRAEPPDSSGEGEAGSGRGGKSELEGDRPSLKEVSSGTQSTTWRPRSDVDHLFVPHVLLRLLS